MTLHPYSFSRQDGKDERSRVSLKLWSCSGLLATALAFAIQQYPPTKDLILFAPLLTPVIFDFLNEQMDKRLWKWSIARRIFGIETPIIDGEWKVNVEAKNYNLSKDAENKNPRDCKITATIKIDQSWTRMEISFSTDYSSSHSQSATLTDYGRNYELNYSFQTRRDSPDAVAAHRGFDSIQLKRSGEKQATPVKSTYFTDNLDFGRLQNFETSK